MQRGRLRCTEGTNLALQDLLRDSRGLPALRHSLPFASLASLAWCSDRFSLPSPPFTRKAGNINKKRMSGEKYLSWRRCHIAETVGQLCPGTRRRCLFVTLSRCSNDDCWKTRCRCPAACFANMCADSWATTSKTEVACWRTRMCVRAYTWVPRLWQYHYTPFILDCVCDMGLPSRPARSDPLQSFRPSWIHHLEKRVPQMSSKQNNDKTSNSSFSSIYSVEVRLVWNLKRVCNNMLIRIVIIISTRHTKRPQDTWLFMLYHAHLWPGKWPYCRNRIRSATEPGNTRCATPFDARFSDRNLSLRGNIVTVVHAGLLFAQCDKSVWQHSERPACCPTIDEHVAFTSPPRFPVWQRLNEL